MTSVVLGAAGSPSRGLPPERVVSTGETSAASTRAVERALALLAQVCEQQSLSLAECARSTRLPPSTALRLLRTLEKTDFVARSADGWFAPGPRVIQLGATVLGRQSLVRLAEPALRRIVAATGESAYLVVAGPADTALYIAMVEGVHSVRHTSWVGRSIHASGLAVGSALAGLVPAAGYLAERDAIEPDVTAIAAPVRRVGGIAGALNLLGPTFRIDDPTMRTYGQIVAREASSLAATLGVSPAPTGPPEPTQPPEPPETST